MVKEALELMKIHDNFGGSYVLRVNDNLASWNNKAFKISCMNNKLKVEECEEEEYEEYA